MVLIFLILMLFGVGTYLIFFEKLVMPEEVNVGVSLLETNKTLSEQILPKMILSIESHSGIHCSDKNLFTKDKLKKDSIDIEILGHKDCGKCSGTTCPMSVGSVNKDIEIDLSKLPQTFDINIELGNKNNKISFKKEQLVLLITKKDFKNIRLGQDFWFLKAPKDLGVAYVTATSSDPDYTPRLKEFISNNPSVFVFAEKEYPEIISLLPELGPNAFFIVDKKGYSNTWQNQIKKVDISESIKDGTKLVQIEGRLINQPKDIVITEEHVSNYYKFFRYFPQAK